MKKLMISLTALLALSTSVIAADTTASIKATSEVSKVSSQVIDAKASSSSNYEPCTMWPENPWDVRCPW